MSNIKLYRHPLSGHSHRVELLLSLLGIDAEIITIDLMTGEQKKPEYLAKNPQGQVPLLDDNGLLISDSNAILVYLAMKYDSTRTWLSADAEQAAKIQQMLTLAAGPVASGPGAARLITLFGAGYDPETTISNSHALLATVESLLEGKQWLAADHATIADIANYAYIARAPEGNVSLANYPNIVSWLERIESLPRFVPMHKSAVGLAA
jgi:glutathione S-transferase